MGKVDVEKKTLNICHNCETFHICWVNVPSVTSWFFIRMMFFKWLIQFYSKSHNCLYQKLVTDMEQLYCFDLVSLVGVDKLGKKLSSDQVLIVSINMIKDWRYMGGMIYLIGTKVKEMHIL